MRSLVPATVLALSFTFGCQCGTSLGGVDAGVTDAGPELISCTLSFGEPGSECPQDVPECNFGVCRRPCAANDGCNDPATFCNASTGYCELGCRDSSVCGAGTVCSVGACIQSQGCATKCDCAAGEICSNNSCAQPPASCATNNDCGRGADGDICEDFFCNFSTCIDDDPAPCDEDTDCIGRPGCQSGCTCTGNQVCVADVDCTPQNETETCPGGFYCNLDNQCAPFPACTSETQCAPEGLTCNAGAGLCERARACASNAECTVAPATYCDPSTDFCAQPLCTNGGVTCATGTETCRTSDGRCVPAGTGSACTANVNCDAAEYCNFVNGTGTCEVGCRDNASCGGGQVCNNAHQCEGGGNLKPFGETCSDDAECQVGLICGAITNRCAEECQPSGSDCAGGACCALSGQPCCNSIGFCAGESLGGGC